MKVDKGDQLGHYEIVAALGKGGMGEVYLFAPSKLPPGWRRLSSAR